MLAEKEIKEIKSWLEKSQNPVFFFDNDVDGLCSFLLFRRYIGRGFGIAIKSYPGLEQMYNKKLDELKPDVVFILDKPVVSKEFIDYAYELGIPIIWIDHHPLSGIDMGELKERNVYYYNPIYSKDSTSEPTSYICYRIIEKKDDLWIAMIGCVADQFMPDFRKEFSRKYPDLIEDIEEPSKALFESEIGRLIKILSFALKDKTSNVIKMIKSLNDIKGPYELVKGDGYELILNRYHEIEKKYSKLFERAKENVGKKLLYFQYSGDLSISADLANELIYTYPDKIIVVIFIKGDRANMSLRGKNDVREILKKALEGTSGVGGGHKNACGGTISVKDLEKFKSNLEDILE